MPHTSLTKRYASVKGNFNLAKNRYLLIEGSKTVQRCVFNKAQHNDMEIRVNLWIYGSLRQTFNSFDLHEFRKTRKKNKIVS